MWIRPGQLNRSRPSGHTEKYSSLTCSSSSPDGKSAIPSYCAVRSSPSASPPTTNETYGLHLRFSALRVVDSVSKTTSSASFTAIPTTADCGKPDGETEL